MPYCNACGKYIEEGVLCHYCSRVPREEPYPVPDETEDAPIVTSADAPSAVSPDDCPTHDASCLAGAFPPPAEDDFYSHEESQSCAGTVGNDGAEPQNEGSPCCAGCDAPCCCKTECAEDEAETEPPQPDPASASCGADGAASTCADPAPSLNATFRRAYHRILDTKDSTDRFSSHDVRDHRFLAAIAYLGILWIIPFLAGKNSRFVKFHLGQGLPVLLLDGIAATLGGIAYFTYGFAPVVSPALAALVELTVLFSLVLRIFGVTAAVRGRARELPLIGGYSQQ
ncbi:MAG: DUF4870 domain-containing protein [Eubacteriales bacterium]